MTKTTNENVAKAWQYGNKAVNHTGSYHTDGDNLYSYSLRIGFTKGSKKVLLDYTAGAGHFRSMTTSGKHVSPARYVADVVMNPSVIENTDMSV